MVIFVSLNHDILGLSQETYYNFSAPAAGTPASGRGRAIAATDCGGVAAVIARGDTRGSGRGSGAGSGAATASGAAAHGAAVRGLGSAICGVDGE